MSEQEAKLLNQETKQENYGALNAEQALNAQEALNTQHDTEKETPLDLVVKALCSGNIFTRCIKFLFFLIGLPFYCLYRLSLHVFSVIHDCCTCFCRGWGHFWHACATCCQWICEDLLACCSTIAYCARVFWRYTLYPCLAEVGSCFMWCVGIILQPVCLQLVECCRFFWQALNNICQCLYRWTVQPIIDCMTLLCMECFQCWSWICGYVVIFYQNIYECLVQCYRYCLYPLYTCICTICRWIYDFIVAICTQCYLGWQCCCQGFYDHCLYPLWRAFYDCWACLCTTCYQWICIPIGTCISTICRAFYNCWACLCTTCFHWICVPLGQCCRWLGNLVATCCTWIYDSICFPIYDGIRSVVVGCWSHILVPVGEWIGNVCATIGAFLSSVCRAISSLSRLCC